MTRSALALAGVLLVACPAWSDEPSPPPTPPPATPTTPDEFEVSRRASDEGARAYARGEYDLALKRYEAAYNAAPSAEIWFHIARCHERLGRWSDAAIAYEHYLAGKPAGDDAVQIRERISDLRLRAQEAARLTPPPPALSPPPAPSPPRSLRVPAFALLGVTVALVAGGTGAYFSEWSEYQAKRSACVMRCSPESIDGLDTRVRTAEIAAGTLYAFAGAALVADVILWVVDARQRRERRGSFAQAGALVTF
jgi:tetratricopeptide repeat protein